ncbi:DUF2905 family protein [Keratinibaculum paraultunense]|uniref:DUF2905 family protein n=2 Tax=Keratinibaculum paraultunense TaxID=1278232 RepID=A0A4R3KYC1_9FIRM|nr:DUF2905 family protein [Keratinibaculum paraultunense]
MLPKKHMNILILNMKRSRGDIMTSLGKILLYMGIVFILLGGVLILGEKLGFGKLPGDILIQRGNFTFFFPIVSMLIISIILTVLVNIFRR